MWMAQPMAPVAVVSKGLELGGGTAVIERINDLSLFWVQSVVIKIITGDVLQRPRMRRLRGLREIPHHRAPWLGSCLPVQESVQEHAPSPEEQFSAK